jgi:hypothetical protein
MRQIAALAGGEWPARAMAAALGDADTDVSDGQSALESLLDAIWRVFHATKKVRIHTRDLVGELLAMDEGKWKEAYRGGNISEYYIRRHLKGVIPPSAEARADRRWRKGGPPYWGYHVLHLEDAWKHYLNGRGLPVEIKDTHAQALKNRNFIRHIRHGSGKCRYFK